MTSSQYDDPRLPAIYDALNPADRVDDFYLELARASGGAVIDVGCGTGRLTIRFAATGQQVWGVDPASVMLERAKQRQGDQSVSWLLGSAHNFFIDQHFEFALMTGHAFQCLMDDSVILQSLTNVGRHLSAGGKFVFESRNPNAREWLRWTEELSRETVIVPGIGTVFVHYAVSPMINDHLSYDTFFTLPDGSTLKTTDWLNFPSAEKIVDLARQAGFRRIRLQGDWNGGPFKQLSHDIIVTASDFCLPPDLDRLPTRQSRSPRSD